MILNVHIDDNIGDLSQTHIGHTCQMKMLSCIVFLWTGKRDPCAQRTLCMMYTDASRFFVALHVLRLVQLCCKQLQRGCRPLIAPVLLLSDPQQGGGQDYISRGEGGGQLVPVV